MPRLVAPYLIRALLRLGAHRHPGMIWSLPDTSHVVLTFDDGPGRHTGELLNVLARKKVRAVFFVLGDRCRHYPDLVRQIHGEGHTLGLHGMTHRSFTKMSAKELVEAWAAQRDLLSELVAGLPPVTLCRPPFGHAGKRESTLAAAQGLRLVQMTSLPGRHVLWPPGWEEPTALVVRRAVRELAPGGILTLHDGEDLGRGDHVYTQLRVAETTERVIDAVRQQGLDFGTIPP